MAQEAVPHLSYPYAFDNGGSTISANGAKEIDTPILIVGAGPCGMVQALALARLHKLSSTIIERYPGTTVFPKMEFTNGRTMEIYRAIGIGDDIRAVGSKEVPEKYSNDELVLTSLFEGGKLVHTWKRPGPEDQRKQSHEQNDGSQYFEPTMRCHQIPIEAKLKELVEAEPLITSYWGTTFTGLQEEADSVLLEAQQDDKDTLRFRAKYVIGTDGGGSRVRKSVGLESKRTFLNFTMEFVHFRSAELLSLIPWQRAWHWNMVNGGLLVNQNEKDLWTTHLMVPPGVDSTKLSNEDIMGMTCGGCKGRVDVPHDEIYCRGLWKIDVAVADHFNSTGGRVLLAGDSAHQLSPLGAHGLNCGQGDVFDLTWKLAATIGGWGGKRLLATYDEERRPIAHKNIGYVQQALKEVVIPSFTAQKSYPAGVFAGDGPESDKARADVDKICGEGWWFRSQHNNILGIIYEDSSIIYEEPGDRAPREHSVYLPTTRPGSRAPHVWMKDGTGTHDTFSRLGFNLVDFSKHGRLSEPFIQAAQELEIPLQRLLWDAEADPNLRKVYERDLILVRPDDYVAWRAAEQASSLTAEDAAQILKHVTARD